MEDDWLAPAPSPVAAGECSAGKSTLNLCLHELHHRLLVSALTSLPGHVSRPSMVIRFVAQTPSLPQQYLNHLHLCAAIASGEEYLLMRFEGKTMATKLE